MAYCPECGEQVAEIDVFCPFCGIALPTVSSANQDDLFDSTIVNPLLKTDSPEIISQPDENLIIDETAPEVADNNKAIENIEQNDLEFPAQTTSENWLTQTKSVDVPAEVFNKEVVADTTSSENSQIEQEDDGILSEDVNTEPNESVVNESIGEIVVKDDDVTEEDINFGETEETLNKDLIFDEFDDENAEILSSPAESFNTSYEESEIKEIPSADEPETTAEELISQTSEPEFVMTIPYVPPSSSLEKESDITKSAAAEISDEISTSAAESVDEAVVEDLIVTEEAIKKPIEELPEIECQPSKFDSVSIREKVEPKDEVIEAAVSPAFEPLAENLNIYQSQKKESRSHTSPNMGTGDTDGKKRAKLQPLDEGAILNGRYEIVRKIGGGGMGAVYLASDKNLGGVLRAVKEMVQSYIEETQQDKAVSDFKRESMLLTSLEHQSIPTIYDYFFDEKEARFYLVMKYISGGDLAARIRSANQGRIDEKEVTEWSIQIADVLDYLHNRQPPIVYRDLKPANIMIDGNSGRVMLIDFGIARWINKEEKGVTAVGTMGYAPPELFSGNVESRSDIYSLGSTMFHLLTGADPQSNPLLIFDFQKHPRPRQINPQLSDQMEKILMKSVEYSAENRFASAAALRQSLEEHLANLKANKITFGVGQTPTAVPLSDEPVFCGFCGQRIVATDMFCAFCGAKQPLAQHAGHSESYASPPPTARLMIIGTNELETPAYKIEKDENLVGRRDPMSNIFPEVDLSKYDPQTKISRRHARIWREGNQFLVEDLGSSNGTVVLPVINETVRLLPHQPYTLSNGDKLRLGDTTLHFIIG